MCAITATDKQASASMQGLVDKEAANTGRSTPSEPPPIVDAAPPSTPVALAKQKGIQSMKELLSDT